MGLFDSLAPKVNNQAMRKQTNLLGELQDDNLEQRDAAIGDITSGYHNGLPIAGNAVNLFKGITADRQGATDAYYNSLGLNGDDGSAAAKAQFLSSLQGGDTALDFANQNVMRNQANLGQLNGGDTQFKLYELGRGLQNDRITDWQNRLQGQDVLPAATAQASQMNHLAEMFSDKGKTLANARLGWANPVNSGYNNQAGLIGQQESVKMAAEQQGWANALGIGNMVANFIPSLGGGGSSPAPNFVSGSNVVGPPGKLPWQGSA